MHTLLYPNALKIFLLGKIIKKIISSFFYFIITIIIYLEAILFGLLEKMISFKIKT